MNSKKTARTDDGTIEIGYGAETWLSSSLAETTHEMTDWSLFGMDPNTWWAGLHFSNILQKCCCSSSSFPLQSEQQRGLDGQTLPRHQRWKSAKKKETESTSLIFHCSTTDWRIWTVFVSFHLRRGESWIERSWTIWIWLRSIENKSSTEKSSLSRIAPIPSKFPKD